MRPTQRQRRGRSAVKPWLPRVGLVLALLASGWTGLNAQDYPNRTVRIVVPFPAGGTADAMPRIVADWLARKWGRAVVIENKPGAAGNIGAETVYRADPDGHTLLATPPPPLVINRALYPNLGFDPQQFEPIVIMGRVPSALVVNPRIKAGTVPEFIAQARANPGRITAATQGIGTTSHLTSELFQMAAQVTFQQVPYRGSAPALAGLLAGDVDVMFDNLGVSLALVRGGQLKLIAVATPQRMASLPDVPTIAETLPGFDSAAWFSVVAPPRTPPRIVAAINAAVNEALHQDDVIRRLLDLSAEPIGGSPQAMAAYMRDEAERWGKVIKTTGVKLP
jgi:tripartite-type tricarboxylate transporter receptor subunit TctC